MQISYVGLLPKIGTPKIECTEATEISTQSEIMTLSTRKYNWYRLRTAMIIDRFVKRGFLKSKGTLEKVEK